MALPAGPRRTLTTIVVMVATLMQTLDQTIANVALPHMQGSLNASQDQLGWILTSYVVAAAISLMLTNLLVERYGRRRIFLTAIAGFTVTSVLCGSAQTINEMVAFRILQGICAAWVVPLSQAILMDIYPREKQSQAIAMWGVGVTVGPILGPAFGAFLTESFNWRWIFFINLPISVLTLTGIFLLVRETPRAPRHHFDIPGFLFLGVSLGALQLMLDRGQTLDWFSSPEIVIEAILAVMAAYLFVVHVLTTPRPFITLELYRNPTYVLSLFILLLFGALPIASMVMFPLMLQTVMGYTVIDAGLMIAPRGLGMMLSLMVGVQAMRTLGPRTCMFFGLLGSAVTCWITTGFTTDTPRFLLLWSGLLQGIAMGVLFLPVNVVVFESLEERFITEAASMSMLMRSIGSAVSVSLAMTLLSQNGQVARADLAPHVNVFSRPLQEFVADSAFSSAPTAIAMADMEINRQAAMTAFVDNFYILMVLSVVLMPMIFLLRSKRRPAKAEDAVAATVG